MATILTINRSTPNDGLGNTLYDQAGIINDNFAELNLKKVEVVPGFGLSSNDYTTAEQTKLAGIAVGAEVNVQADWNQSDPDQDDYIKNKPVISTGEIFIFDGIADVTIGIVNAQTDFILPSGAVAQRVYLNAYPIWKTTLNNTSLVGRWSQTGDTLTLTDAVVTNDYLYIEYK